MAEMAALIMAVILMETATIINKCILYKNKRLKKEAYSNDASFFYNPLTKDNL